MTRMTTSGAEVVTVTFGGRTFRAGRRTAAHIEYTFEEFARQFPKASLVIAQPCYNTGVDASAGTHDKDGVLDFVVIGLDWWTFQRFMRKLGWACWYRHTGSWADRSNWHVHAISLGCPGPVGWYVPQQITDYYNHTFGLANQHNVDLDKSWFPGDIGSPPWPVGTQDGWRRAIDRTIFGYSTWLEDQVTEQDKQDIIDGVWKRAIKVIGESQTINAASMLAQVHNRTGDTRALVRQLVKANPALSATELTKAFNAMRGEDS